MAPFSDHSIAGRIEARVRQGAIEFRSVRKSATGVNETDCEALLAAMVLDSRRAKGQRSISVPDPRLVVIVLGGGLPGKGHLSAVPVRLVGDVSVFGWSGRRAWMTA